jgi:hypothetical protein
LCAGIKDIDFKNKVLIEVENFLKNREDTVTDNPAQVSDGLYSHAKQYIRDRSGTFYNLDGTAIKNEAIKTTSSSTTTSSTTQNRSSASTPTGTESAALVDMKSNTNNTNNNTNSNNNKRFYAIKFEDAPRNVMVSDPNLNSRYSGEIPKSKNIYTSHHNKTGNISTYPYVAVDKPPSDKDNTVCVNCGKYGHRSWCCLNVKKSS